MIGDYTESMNRAAAGTSAALRAGGIGDVTSSERGTGARFNAGKPPFDLIPLRLLADCIPPAKAILPENGRDYAEAMLRHVGQFQRTGNAAFLRAAMGFGFHHWPDCADVFAYGREKYAAWNWAKGMPWSVAIGCIGRHATAMLRGEVDDPESGLPHIGHALCNVVMLLTWAENYPEGNDLPPPELFK